MRNNIKAYIKPLVAVLCLALMLMMTLCTSAAASYVVDDASLLTEAQARSMDQKLQRLSQQQGHDIIIVTTDSLEYMGLEEYADFVYETMGYGAGETKSCIMLLVAMDVRKYEISAHGAAVDIISESDYDRIENSFVDYLTDGSYLTAFDAFADQCEYVIKYDKRLSPVWIFIALLVGAAIAGIVVWAMASKHKSVKFASSANSYMRRDTFRLDRSRDVYLYSHVTRVARPKSNSSGGGRGSSGGGRSGRSGSF